MTNKTKGNSDKQMDKRINDSRGNPIRNPKMIQCERQISLNDLEIIELKRKNQDLKVNEFGLNAVVLHFLEKIGFNAEKEAAELSQIEKENDRKIRDNENINGALKKCMTLNSNNFNFSCQKCQKRPLSSEQVIEYPRK